jgi:hypothetical protein
LRITAQGRIGAHQPQFKDRTPLDPLRAQIRIVSIYDPTARKAWLIDLRYGPLEALAGLWDRKLLIHNASFDLGMLEAAGISPEDIVCTQQLAGLVYGCIRGSASKPGSRALVTIAQKALGIELGKVEQTSDWSAPYLSASQKIYAGLDPAVCYLAARQMYQDLPRRSRPALELQSASARATARMRLKGLPFNAETHRATIATAWQPSRSSAEPSSWPPPGSSRRPIRLRSPTGSKASCRRPSRTAWTAPRRAGSRPPPRRSSGSPTARRSGPICAGVGPGTGSRPSARHCSR